MARTRMRVIAVLISLLTLIAVLVGAALLFVWSSLPVVSGTTSLPGLNAEVRVVRDRWGIPHIFANDELDALRALGFTAAQDRLFQMDIHRRLANGQLSEIFGPSAVQIDE